MPMTDRGRRSVADGSPITRAIGDRQTPAIIGQTAVVADGRRFSAEVAHTRAHVSGNAGHRRPSATGDLAHLVPMPGARLGGGVTGGRGKPFALCGSGAERVAKDRTKDHAKHGRSRADQSRNPRCLLGEIRCACVCTPGQLHLCVKSGMEPFDTWVIAVPFNRESFPTKIWLGFRCELFVQPRQALYVLRFAIFPDPKVDFRIHFAGFLVWFTGPGNILEGRLA